MKPEEVRSIAKPNGVSPGKSRQHELTGTILAAGGNFDCFATARHAECDQTRCLWRNDCFDVAQQGELS